MNKTMLAARAEFDQTVSNQIISNQIETGFSVVKMLFWLAVIGFVFVNGSAVGLAYYNNTKVQDSFDHLSRKMPAAAEPEIRLKLQEVFHVQYIDKKDLPDEFYDALQIKTTGQGFEISSAYMVTVWPFGRVEERDEFGEYDPENLTGLESLRDKTRIDLFFKPYAISPVENQ
ncbi:MAG: hypothetical protein Q9M16_04185 [Mariprofundus sp.]|nr:hypothetical protein [Mariprofundus sp.]